MLIDDGDRGVRCGAVVVDLISTEFEPLSAPAKDPDDDSSKVHLLINNTQRETFGSLSAQRGPTSWKDSGISPVVVRRCTRGVATT